MKKYPAHARLPGIGVFLSRIIARLDPEGELLPHPRPAADLAVAEQAVLRSEKVVGGKDAATTGMPTVTAVATQPLTMNETLRKWDYAPLPMPGEGTEMQYWHGSALVAALDCEDETVQYAAAQALAAINRFPATWEGQEKVGAILGRGVSENQPIQVLLVVEDGSRPTRNNTAAEMRLRLEGLGFGVSIADSGRDAMLKARSFPPKDVIVVDNILRRNLTSVQLLEELKADPRTRYTPVGLLYDLQERTEIQARFGASISLVAVESQGKDLREEIEKLNAQRPPEALPTRKAHETAVACALALGALDPRWTHVRLQDAVPHCVKALTNRPDDLRNAAAIFLGRAKGVGMKDAAAEALKAVALNRDNAAELRQNAIRSLGHIRPEADEDAYMALQADDDQGVRFEASVVFGRFLRKNEKVVQFLRDNRIEKDLKEK
jgi:hypothetical protein